MPHKFNAARRHKFPKKRYRVTNWAEYTEILRRRGDLTIWVTDDTLKQWRAPRRTTPGGQPKYSNIAIETCLIPTVIDQNPCAHLRMPRDMIFHGWSMRLFQAWQHSATMSS